MINDPGNAGTASGDHERDARPEWPEPRLVDGDGRKPRRDDPEARRRASALINGPLTAAMLIGAFVALATTHSVLWTLGVIVIWLAACIVAQSILTAVYGPPPRAGKTATARE